MNPFSVTCGDMRACYESTGFTLQPLGGTVAASSFEPLVQVSLAGDRSTDLWASGRTLRNRSTTRELAYAGHRIDDTDGVEVTVDLAGPVVIARHTLRWRTGDECVQVRTEVTNRSDRPVDVRLLASFCLTGPEGDDLLVHRLRSEWSAEARLVSEPAERLGLTGWPPAALAVERFGQLGTLPVRGYAPNIAVEDRAAGVVWAAQLAWAGSWQLELYRRGGPLSIAGGLADADFGHWTKTLAPGESFAGPPAWLTVVSGGADDAFQRLVRRQEVIGARTSERDLPALANEFATTWGRPTAASVLAMADRLAGTPVRYLVIDAGWYSGGHGDWQVNREAFPDGLEPVARAVRDRGLVPGLWVEFETCAEDSTAFSLTEHLLHDGGVPITAGGRRFWDFRDPFVADYLTNRVERLLADTGIGYVKIDYNDTPGAGCDGAESPGEGLRRQVEATHAFYRGLRERLPGVVFENCASGGLRHEPSYLDLADIGSFSDAMEGHQLPIVAANTNRLLPGHRAAVWVVPRRTDTDQDLIYKLCTGMLGRPCLSGDFLGLTDSQWRLVLEALELYQLGRPALAGGHWQRFGPDIASYRTPQGWQGLLRTDVHTGATLAVLHAFADPTHVEIPLPGPLAVAASLNQPEVKGTVLQWTPPGPFTAAAALLLKGR